MKGLSIVPLLAIALSACSETPIEEQGEDAIAELDRQIERDANSLEEAADEAVQALEAEIAAELEDDGITAPETGPPEDDSEEGE